MLKVHMVVERTSEFGSEVRGAYLNIEKAEVHRDSIVKDRSLDMNQVFAEKGVLIESHDLRI